MENCKVVDGHYTYFIYLKIIHFSAFRKRHNPLYEEEKDAMVPKKSKAQSGLSHCPCLAILIFSILSLVTFILVILLMAGVVTTSNSSSGKFDTL